MQFFLTIKLTSRFSSPFTKIPYYFPLKLWEGHASQACEKTKQQTLEDSFL
jgi:hypothetical protein